MTYCVGLALDKGLVFMSDTRTNAGVDNVSVFRKMRHWTAPGERVLVLMSAGNLATTQAVVSLLEERAATDGPSLLTTPSMFRTAQLVGAALREVIANSAAPLSEPDAEATFRASLILGGQIKGEPPRLFLIYPEGNFIEATPDTPFFQIGETKYGRPIIVRAWAPDMEFEEAVKLLMVSFDSTLKANLSVGLPLDLSIVPVDEFRIASEVRIEADDPWFDSIARGWGASLTSALKALPAMPLDLTAAPKQRGRPGKAKGGDEDDAAARTVDGRKVEEQAPRYPDFSLRR